MIDATLDTLMAVDTIKSVVNNASGGSSINWFELIIVKTIIPVTIGAVAAIVATLTALRRFRTQKYWELRLKAYTDSITALEKMYSALDADLREVYEARQMSDEERDHFRKKWREGKEEIRKTRQIEALLLSAKALALLDIDPLFAEATRGIDPGNWFKIADNEACVLSKVIKKMIAQSKKDLKLR